MANKQGAIDAVVWGDNNGITLQRKPDRYMLYVTCGINNGGQWWLTEDEVRAIRDACNELLPDEEEG